MCALVTGVQTCALPIFGGLFVLETVSVMVQVASFKLTGKRVFRMAPLHHHFEKKGWKEPTIVIRFWIIAVILALAGLSTLRSEARRVVKECVSTCRSRWTPYT